MTSFVSFVILKHFCFNRVEHGLIFICLQETIKNIYLLGRKLSPTAPTNRLAIEAPNEKDEGISDEEDPAELRLLLELNEQVNYGQ